MSGIGYIIEGDIDVADNRTIYGSYTSMEVEFYALVEALRIASQRFESDTRAIAYTDAKPLRDKMCDDERHRDEWQTYYDSCHWLLGKFAEWEIRYVPRGGNADAHELARRALHEGRETL